MDVGGAPPQVKVDALCGPGYTRGGRGYKDAGGVMLKPGRRGAAGGEEVCMEVATSRWKGRREVLWVCGVGVATLLSPGGGAI